LVLVVNRAEGIGPGESYMNILSSPVVAMAGISLYVGLYHLLIFIRRPQNRADLTFALLCFSIAVYDAFSFYIFYNDNWMDSPKIIMQIAEKYIISVFGVVCFQVGTL